MKRIAVKMISVFCALCALVSVSAVSAGAMTFSNNVDLHCESVLMINTDNEQVVFEKNADEKRYPASTTKIMTYIVAYEHIDDLDNTKIPIKQSVMNQLKDTDSSLANVAAHVGSTMSAVDLLYSMMVPSGNDAALTLADYVGDGDVNKFVDMMNEKAEELGCENTHFQNPDGLHNEDHYTTARDLYKITTYARTLPLFDEICNTTEYYCKGDNTPLITTNYLIDSARGGQYYYRYAKGIKTGTTDEAGRCLVTTGSADGNSYILVLLGAPYKMGVQEEYYTFIDAAALFRAGIWPITMATTILKPGGYRRMNQIAESLAACGYEPFHGVDVQAVKALDEGVAASGHYRKPVKPLPDRKTGRSLPLFDCFTAPCRDGCPIGQDIPAYLQAMLEDDPEKALRIVLERNPLPFITGTICPHHCGDKCMRNYYEETLHIRETKLAAAKQAFDKVIPSLKAGTAGNGKRVAVVGAGPAGLAAAMLLSRLGVPVTVFERKDKPGGVVAHVIPDFRITADAIEKDIAICRAFGAEIVCGREITSIGELKAEGYTDVIVAVGAWKHGKNPLESGECLDALAFLEQLKTDPGSIDAGRDIVVLGGGNTAMDVARAAKRLPGGPNVRLVYRRTRRYMPADEEELQMALEDGVEFMELLAPERLENGKLICHVMELGAPDASGRRSPVDTGEIKTIPADTVIAAVGEQVDTALFEAAGCEIDAKGRPVADEGMKTSVEGVYAIGDARRGPATVVEGIADAWAATVAIAGVPALAAFRSPDETSLAEELYLFKKGRIAEDVSTEPDWRCLGCPSVCEVCADVCPNRANVAVHVPGKCQAQIIHVDGMCNECGNCAVFCPYSGKPYRDKFTLFWSEEDFTNSENEGFLMTGEDRVRLRLDGKEQTVGINELDSVSADAAAVIRTIICEYGHLILNS